MHPALYYGIIFIELIFAFGMFLYVTLLLYSGIMGSPHVPTRKKEIELILKHMNLKKRQFFLELGCGDGRVLRTAAKLYEVEGLGIDINPWVIAPARMYTRMQKLKNIEFRIQNLWKTDFSQADIIYLFLMPKLLGQMKPRLATEVKKDALIVSHGFKIEGFGGKLIKKLDRKPFPTYFYKI